MMTNTEELYKDVTCPFCGKVGLKYHHQCQSCGLQLYCPNCKEVI